MAQPGDRPAGEAGSVSRPKTDGPSAHAYDAASISTSSTTSSNTRYDKPFLASKAESPSTLSRFNPKSWSRKMKLISIAAAVSALVLVVPAIAVPLALEHRQGTSDAAVPPPTSTSSGTPVKVDPPATSIVANDTALRIMPLGASITFGFLSSDGNGYREDLRTLIEQGGNSDVSFVGSRNNGTMTDNAVEGWPGYRIDQVLPKAQSAVPASLPNVILLNVGTNDCVQGYNMDNTTKNSALAPVMTENANYTIGDRMRIFVESLFEWSPNATVVMSTLILNKVELTNQRVNDANAKFAAVAADLQAQGRRVVLANMSAAAGGPNLNTMADVTHPNDIGYSLMANRWYLAIQEASDRNMIVAPQ